MPDTEPAREPEDLARMFVERVNAQDVDGLVALHEDAAVLATPDGASVRGAHAIRRSYTGLLAPGPVLAPGRQHPGPRLGDLALTSTRLPGGSATAEVARRQPDGTWRWILDRPSVI